jgi:hypothetical protein
MDADPTAIEQDMKPKKTAQSLHQELQSAKKADDKWIKRAKKIVKRYRDDRSSSYDGNKRYNILWSNVQVLMPSLYGKTPKAQVERRWKDKDPIARTAAVIMERALQYEIDNYGDFENSTRSATLDRLLSGRGTVWVRFEAKEIETVGEEMEGYEQPMIANLPTAIIPQQGQIQTETTPVDYVYWEDFRCSPARCWDEVTWVARRVYMARNELESRFGEDITKRIPMTHEPIGLDEMRTQGMNQSEIDRMKKAQVWEIWDKSEECVYWVAEGCDEVLDHKPDPYGLDNFWPCPKPLFATMTTDTLVPVPDYVLYQDQADEIDDLTKRIGLLVDAVKVVGVYDASQPAIQRMLNEGVDNVLIPVDSWAAFSEKGGVQGTVQFMPLDMVIKALQTCYESRERAKQVVYDVTGLSDIIRGSSMASETATAQQIKGQYASMRLKSLQHNVALFVTETLRIKAQLMMDLYSPNTLINMSGIQGTDDAQYAQQALQLIKSEPARNYRIDIEAESLAEMDEMAEKQSRIEFLTAFSQAMNNSLPIIQQSPDLAPLVGEAMMFVVRTFKSGRALEATLESTLEKMREPKPEQPNPEMMKAQAQQQADQMRLQHEAGLEQARQQVEAAKLQAQQQADQIKLQAQVQIEQFKAETAKELEQMKQQAETERQAYKAQLEAQTKLQIAEMQAAAQQKPAAVLQIDAQDKLNGIADIITQAGAAHGAGIADAVNQLGTVAQALLGTAEELKKPKKRVIQRDQNGKAIAAIEVLE